MFIKKKHSKISLTQTMLYIIYCIAQHKISSFELSSIDIRFFIGYGLELSQIVPLILFHLKRKYLCKTENELKEAWRPSDFEYETRVPGDILILTVILCYSVFAPIIIPFSVLYFGMGWLALRNQVKHHSIFFGMYQFLVENPPFWSFIQLGLFLY